MPLRDDHDAALARADALQAELERQHAEHADQAAHVAKLEAELAEARSRLSRAEEALSKIRPVRAPKPPALEASPTSSEPARGRAPVSSRMILIGAATVGTALVLFGALASKRRSTDAPASAPPGPKPPYVADPLLREGLAQIREGLRLDEVHLKYVGADGLLDPTYGAIEIGTSRRSRPKPPDDPNRPTGAPEPNEHHISDMMATCDRPTWNPHTGWASGMGSCVSFHEPVGLPTCTVGEILSRARADAAPQALSTIDIRWEADRIGGAVERLGWRWRIAIHDRARRVDFSRDYLDDCR